MSEPVLAVAGLTKKFGDFVAVDDVSFEVQKGQSLAVVPEIGSMLRPQPDTRSRRH